MSVDAVLALGSNQGESRRILAEAVGRLGEHPRVSVTARSPVVITAPVGGPADQPDFLNMVVGVRTDLRPFALLRWCQEIEHRFHRVRTVRWGPRTLDVDIIWIDGYTSNDPDLTVPHPRAHLRQFVLQPWLEMDPDAELNGVRVAALLADLDDQGVRKL